MISLIVPVYNVGEYLEEFLESVVAQTFHDFEAILVDDGSTDNSAALLDGYAEKYAFMKVIHKPNGGCISAWKRGLQESQGEYISFVDPDDIMLPASLETQYRLMTENDADLVITGVKRLEHGELIDMPADGWSLREGVYEGDELKNIKENLFGNSQNQANIFLFAKWNKLFKKQIVLDNLHYTNEEVVFGEDVCISASAIYDSKKIYYSKEPLYIYRIRDDSLTTVNFKLREIDKSNLLIKCVHFMIEQKGYMNEFIFYHDPSYHIVRLARKICSLSVPKKKKKQFLKILKSHEFVASYNLKRAKKYLSFRRYFAIWLLKHGMYGAFIFVSKRS